MSYHGDIRLGDTVDFKFTTVDATGAPTTLAGTPVVSAYPGNSTTELTAGITLTVDFDGRTGMHNVRVVATSGNGYATATEYHLVITTGTVGGVSVVGYVIGSFSIEDRSALMPTTAARTAAIDASGRVDVGAVGGTAQTAGDIMADTNDIQARLPAALSSGRIAAEAQVVTDKTAYALTTAEEDAIVNKLWDELTSEGRTAGSFGQLFKDRIDATISSRAATGAAMTLASGAVNAAAINADTDVYSAKLWLIDDNAGSNDRYVVAWYKNGQPVTSGITSPTLQVVKAADGTDLIGSTAMTQIGTTGVYRYNEATNRVVSGALYFADVRATIDGSERKHLQPVGRDS